MTEIVGGTCVEAWKNVVEHLLSHKGQDFNLLVTIDNPTQIPNFWFNKYDPRLVSPKADSLASVTNTIFPSKIWRFSDDRDHFYKRCHRAKQLSPMARRKFGNSGSSWGTYIDRLVSFGGQSRNQLEDAIQKLNAWPTQPKAALVFHLSSPETDRPKPRGGPCWQFGEICGRPGNVCDLVVVYRNHDYLHKALGNFIAFGYLIDFICSESNKIPGRLICHSVHADFGDGSQRSARELAEL